MLEEVYARAEKSISAFSPEKNEALLKSIIEKNEASGKRIYSNAASESIVRKLTSLKYAGNIECLGGVVIENEDGTVRLDYTYDVILKSVSEQLLKQTSDILFG